jgi:tRNA(fMet)-specific endonuclease VapC
MTRWMLDTNTVSYFLRDALASAPAAAVRFGEASISAITAAELIYGMRKRPDAHNVNRHVGNFITGINVVPFGREASETYGSLRAEMQRLGKSLTELDMLIAAHSMSIGVTLVTSDAAFRHVPGLAVEDWR